MNRAHGLDVNHWEGTYTHVPNPPRPVEFVIQKLTEAVYKDLGYDTLKQQIQCEAIRGGYHYLRGPAMGSWKSQAEIFLKYFTDDYQFWALDVEKMNNYRGLPIFDRPADGYVDAVVPWLEYVAEKSGRPGLLYTGPDMWATWLKPYWSQLIKYDLWVAHYWNKPNPEGTPNYYTVRGAGTMRRDWRFWQYDDQGQGGRGKEYGVGSKELDLNVYNGTVDDLLKWVNPLHVPVQEPVSQPVQEPAKPEYIVWSPSWVFATKNDGLGCKLVDRTRTGEVVTVSEVSGEWAKLSAPTTGWVKTKNLRQT